VKFELEKYPKAIPLTQCSQITVQKGEIWHVLLFAGTHGNRGFRR